MDQRNDLNILVIGKFYTEGFALHIAETLETIGHRVVRFEPGVRYKNERGVIRKRWTQVKTTVHDLAKQFPVIQRGLTRHLLGVARNRQPINLTIVCHDFLLPKEVQCLREETNSPVVLWFPDHIANFQRAFFLNAEYDGLFFKDPYVVYRLNQMLSSSIYYLPECCNPRYHKPCELSPRDAETYGCDVATAGNMYPYRAAFFRQLKEYEVKIWGNPPPLWMDVSSIGPMLQGRYVSNEEKSKAFRAAKIVVNNLHPAEVWGINARAFEIAGAGGFQLLDERIGIDQLFEDGRELVTFSSMDDLKDKIDYYLEREEERSEIADRGQKRAHREHTYEARLALLLETVFSGAKGFPMPDSAYAHDKEFQKV